jgi:hypothetical protein
MKYKVTDHTGEDILTEEELIAWEKFLRQQSKSFIMKDDEGYEYHVEKIEED